ncbi:uncharacterized protein BCR38DRAFT_488248 [Pseudomassariella vexata]|uniref:SRR1-like domain-containing protein n=1 Tax=Pseudomassariella vexata TaxID=1141098 RepID=A0A1Y2DLP3_9PEZI|nr:uncharacterized protein BCR38DRAFT_488248 [Pseudomassariella vexata]ORY60059.1 hypothetical protein BCR38DRAFT_488248 [Pseudomassariella vexata]
MAEGALLADATGHETIPHQSRSSSTTPVSHHLMRTSVEDIDTEGAPISDTATAETIPLSPPNKAAIQTPDHMSTEMEESNQQTEIMSDRASLRSTTTPEMIPLPSLKIDEDEEQSPGTPFTQLNTNDLQSMVDVNMAPLEEGDRRNAAEIQRFYQLGSRLWTTGMFEELEDCIKQADGKPSFIEVRCLDANWAMNWQDWSQKPQDGKPLISFRLYQELVYNCAAPGNSGRCAVYLDSFTKQVPKMPSGVLAAQYHEVKKAWNISMVCLELRDLLEKLRIPGGKDGKKGISKLICFGLGTMEEDFVDKLDPKPWRSMTQHAALMTIVDLLEERQGHRIPIVAQDPWYTEDTRDILECDNVDVAEGYGSLAFTQIDSQTLVYSVNPSVPVKQIIADIARPAIMICNRIKPRSEEKTEWEPVQTGDTPTKYLAPWCADEDSPRTREMAQEYNTMNFPDYETPEPPRFGDLKVYVRKADFVAGNFRKLEKSGRVKMGFEA